MPDTNNSRKERERQFHRKVIMDAAVISFAEKGFVNATLDEIAQRAEYGKGTIYNYFANKEEIYSAILEKVMNDSYEIAKTADEETTTSMDFFSKLTLNLFNYCIENKYPFLLLAQSFVNVSEENLLKTNVNIHDKQHCICGTIEKRIELGIKKKEIKKMDTKKLAILYDHLVYPYIHHLILNEKNQVNSRTETDFILSILFNGILNK